MQPNRADRMRAAFAPARCLEPSEAEVARALARVRSRRSPQARRAVAAQRWRFATGLAAGLIAITIAVPGARAALEAAGDGVAGVFTGWIAGASSGAPGAPLRSSDGAPEYVYDKEFAREPRVIAEAGGYKLFAYLTPGGGVGFELGDTGVGMSFPSPAELGERPLYVLGPGAMRHADGLGHVPLFGVAAKPVRTVELAYEDGPPLRLEGVEGGFVLLAEPAREPREIIALDAGGRVLGRELVDGSPHPGPRIDWSEYLPG